MLITTDRIMEMGPCYGEARVRELVRDGLTPEKIAGLNIPAIDRLWVLIRLLEPADQRLLAAACAERALMAARVTNERSWSAVRVARLHALGEATDRELEAARAAAQAAARDAAQVAARAAARAAAQAAARAAVWDVVIVDAARAASRAAAQAAARAAVWAAVWDVAIVDALMLIGDTDGR